MIGCRDESSAINQRQENSRFLPERAVSDRATADLPISRVRRVVVVTRPSICRDVLERAPEATTDGAMSREARKDGENPHHVARNACPGARLAVLSGPTFAHEVARGLPTAVTLAAQDPELAEQLRDRLSQPTFRIYVSDDVAGAEVGGAVKNVLAIACGVVEGKLGQNASATLIGRVIPESWFGSRSAPARDA